MYNQTYELPIPTTIPMVFNCSSMLSFNLEFKNTGGSPFSSVVINANLVPDGEYMTWLNALSHFDRYATPHPKVVGLHGENIFSLAPGSTGTISLKTGFVYSLLVEVTSDAATSIFLRAYGEER